jgi:hypothetical protein
LSSEVNIPPLETEEFAHAQSGTSGQENKSLLSVTQPASESIDFGRQKHLRLRPPLCALADEADGIAVDEVVPPRMVKEDTHQISNLGATAPGKWEGAKPQFNLDCSDGANIACSPSGRDPFSQVAFVGNSR